MAQFLDAESRPDFIDITSTTEEEGQGPPQSEQGGAGVSDTEFDPDIYLQPDRTVCCAASMRTTTVTLVLWTHESQSYLPFQFYVGATMDDAPLLDHIQDLLSMRTNPTDLHTCAFGEC